ncbi:MAG: SusC/RagA family TonB-linked outer membrane protein, partial [Bacteroidales bacterium]
RRVMPSTVGIGSALPYANIGKVKNRGADFSADFNHAFRSDVILSLKGNFTFSRNKLIERDEPQQLYAYQSEIGQPLNRHFGLLSDGLYTAQDIEDINNGLLPRPTFNSNIKAGDIKYKDLNNDNVIDKFDMTYFGKSSVPEIVYGFGGSLRYKKFDMSVFFQGVGGTTILMDLASFGNERFSLPQFIVDNHWSESNPNPNAKFPRLSPNDFSHNIQKSDFYARNGSFLRLKNAEIAYTHKFMRVYASGSNLLTFSSFKHWDPELGSGKGTSYPVLRVYNVGIQLNFN